MKTNLTNRENEIIQLIGWGASVKEICDYLKITANTIRTHIKNIKAKLGLQKSNELSAYYFVSRYNLPFSDDPIGNILKLKLLTLLCLYYG